MSKASLLELCHSEKKYIILNKQVKFLTSQYIGTCKCVNAKGYALNWALTIDGYCLCLKVVQMVYGNIDGYFLIEY